MVSSMTEMQIEAQKFVIETISKQISLEMRVFHCKQSIVQYTSMHFMANKPNQLEICSLLSLLIFSFFLSFFLSSSKWNIFDYNMHCNKMLQCLHIKIK